MKGHTALRGFDLATGAQKLGWNLPGDNSTCNDFAVEPDKALYIADTANSKIYKLPVNNVFSNNLYRIPVDAEGQAGSVWLVSPQGEKIAALSGTPPVYWQGQNGMLGVFVSPNYATDQSICLTYIEPGDYGGGQALPRAKLVTGRVNRLENFDVL